MSHKSVFISSFPFMWYQGFYYVYTMTAFNTILSLYSKHSKPLFSTNSKYLLSISTLVSDKPGMRKSLPEVWVSEGLLSLIDVLGCRTVLRNPLPTIHSQNQRLTNMQLVHWIQTEVPFLLFIQKFNVTALISKWDGTQTYISLADVSFCLTQKGPTLSLKKKKN